MKKYSFLILAVVILGGVIFYEWRRRSQSALAGVSSQAGSLKSSASISEPETGNY